MIDTHAHLDDDRFAEDLPEVLERAVAAGLERILVIATTAPTSRKCVALARAHPLLRATVGIQPNHVAEAGAGDWDEVVRLAGEPEVVGIGETGLDRHWKFTPFPQQEEYFARHLTLAREKNLPVVIHCREAEADVVRMLRDDFERHGPVRGVMHSYSGDQATADACLAMGLYISFAGMVTYKNAANLRTIAQTIPRDRILIETDAPYLAPVPHRGQRNEPAYVRHTAACLAQVRGESPEDFAAAVTANARRLFDSPK